MRTLPIIALLSLSISCGSACGGPQVLHDQATPAAACLPAAVAEILAASAAHNHTAVIVAVTTLLACWATHQPPRTPPDAAPAVGMRLARYPGDDDTTELRLVSVTCSADGSNGITYSSTVATDITVNSDTAPPTFDSAIATAGSTTWQHAALRAVSQRRPRSVTERALAINGRHARTQLDGALDNLDLLDQPGRLCLPVEHPGLSLVGSH